MHISLFNVSSACSVEFFYEFALSKESKERAMGLRRNLPLLILSNSPNTTSSPPVLMDHLLSASPTPKNAIVTTTTEDSVSKVRTNLEV